MDDNSIFMKIFNYSWLIIVLIPFFNGIGFIFAGWRVDETKWMDEGIFYMIPFILFSIAVYNTYIVYFGIILWIIAIIRAALIIRPYTEKLNKKQEMQQHTDNNEIFETNYKLNQFLEKNETATNNMDTESVVDPDTHLQEDYNGKDIDKKEKSGRRIDF